MKYIKKGQIIAGAILLGFDWIDEDSIKMLADSFIKDNPEYNYLDYNAKEYLKYLSHQGNKYILVRKQYEEGGYIKPDAAVELDNLVGPEITEFYQNLNIEKFVLLKLWNIVSYSSQNEDLLFSKFEQEYLRKLKEKGCLEITADETSLTGESQVTISKRGGLELFKYLHPDDLDRFKDELKIKRINTDILDDFLIEQEILIHSTILEDVGDVLTVERLEEYCKSKVINFFQPGQSRIDFRKLNDYNKVAQMLTIYDDAHSICVCHPNHIFAGEKVLGNGVHDITSIAWDDINPSKMIKKAIIKSLLCQELLGNIQLVD